MHNACERFCNVDSLSTICIVDKEMRKAKQVIGAANSLCEGEKEKQMLQGQLSSRERVVTRMQQRRLL